MSIPLLDELEAFIERVLRAGRIPGAALAIVAGGETVFARGYGSRDLETQLPVTPDTIYPIASTSKAFNATLLGMLVEEGRITWDTPVQEYLPRFRLMDPSVTAQVTLRDLVTMRTGLPRHDWLWIENPIARAALVERLRYLEFSAGFRERFQYNNLTATAAGHVAEVMTGQSWEELVRQRLFEPLGMTHTTCTVRTTNVTQSYHENSRRELVLTRRLATEVAAPSGGAIRSTVSDMARWMLFNLSGGRASGRSLIKPQSLAEIHSPQVVVGADASGPTPSARYALGWFVDTYNGHARVSHGGYLHDLYSDVMLFPEHDIGVVSFTNFGCTRLAGLINECAFDLLMHRRPADGLEERLEQYEKRIEETRQRNASVQRFENTSPSHSLRTYAGVYGHPGYGEIEIVSDGAEIIFRRNDLYLPLQHWHYDAWIAVDAERFAIHLSHAFDRSSRLVFDTSADGDIAGVTIHLEPSVSPIHFVRQ